MKARLAAITLMFALIGAFVLAPIGVKAAQPASFAIPVDVTGGFLDEVTGEGTFEGVFTLTEVVSSGGNLFAVGTLTGTLTSSLGVVLGVVEDIPIQVPLTASGSCDILNLVLGPLDLDLLGLQVQLDQVVLDVVAQTGSGKLLGNLLCAVTRLLDSNAAGNALANMLNRILGLLG